MPVQAICANCDKPFFCYQSEIEKGRRFCSLQCRSAFRFEKALPAASRTPVHFNCAHCGNDFTMMKSYLTAYRKKFGRDPLYCTMKCSADAYKSRTDAKSTAICKNCGTPFQKTRKPGGGIYLQQQVCSRQCKNEWVSKVYREKHGLPQVTRRIKRGYAILRFPATDGKPLHEILEHRYVMEQFLGRELLPTETVHHKRAWDKTTNTMENLELRTGNHGPGGAIEDLLPWCAEIFETYQMFITPELRERLKAIIEHSD